MPYWNRFSEEVRDELRRLRVAGYPTHASQRPVPLAPSYRAQALRELAHRLLLEQTLDALRDELRRAIDRYEAAEAGERDRPCP